MCVIARDEERALPGCLESTRGIVDEIVLVDTGSSDRTREIARAAGARVLEQPWRDDFSAPRNLAVEHATGDWILQLDADERLAGDPWRDLRAALASARFDCGMIRCHNANRLDAQIADVVAGRARQGPPIPLPRVLRRTPDLRYAGVVHESVSAWVAARGMRVAPLDVDIVHFGAIPALRGERGKDDRNLRLLRRRCALEPDSVTPFGYLALELVSRGALADAAEAVERGWALLQARPADVSVLRLAVARAIVAVEAEEPARALQAVELAERAEGAQPDLHYLRGRAMTQLALRTAGDERERRLREAVAAFRAALGFVDGAFRQYVAGASSWASRNAIGDVMLVLKRPSEAFAAFAEVLAERPDDVDARLGSVEALLQAGRPADALRRVEPLLAQGRDGWLLAGAAAAALGDRRDAVAFTARAAAAGVTFRAAHRSELLERVRGELGMEAA